LSDDKSNKTLRPFWPNCNEFDVKTDNTTAELMKSFNDELEALLKTYDIDSFIFVGKKNSATACLSRIGHILDFWLVKEHAMDIFDNTIEESKLPELFKIMAKDIMNHRKEG